MDLYWSGKAEQKTVYFSRTIPVFNIRHDTVLANGLDVSVQVLATLSLELSASAQVSLWSQSANVQCDNAGALIIIYKVR